MIKKGGHWKSEKGISFAIFQNICYYKAHQMVLKYHIKVLKELTGSKWLSVYKSSKWAKADDEAQSWDHGKRNRVGAEA